MAPPSMVPKFKILFGLRHGRPCFSAVFSGDRTPYSPAKFLHRCGANLMRFLQLWQHAANLASYEQQTHMNSSFPCLMESMKRWLRKKGRHTVQALEIVALHIEYFLVFWRSDVILHGFKSKLWDIYLKGCLERFTRAEKLGSDQKFFCQKCQVRQESLKQMSIRKLPLVSCFHIKRFEHSSIRRMSRKVEPVSAVPIFVRHGSLSLIFHFEESIWKQDLPFRWR
ncbi:hypothetical protein ES319_1Z036900v1 [Gossypium barbadense]|uniref:ubiquitinyl hydrolase 1 n=1 Tax=Gossypium barbadense TaxID=3634 RepID=A0A5J5N985_GOSBA|nr:hypothetical protein ES319_1Z036900v1 [Gossypium barbadense]